MKIMYGVLFSAILVAAIYTIRVNMTQDFTLKQMNIAVETSEKRHNEARLIEEKRYKNEKINVLVRAKDIKTCLLDLKTKVINSEVVECNKDHYVELSRGDVEKLQSK